MNHQTHTTGNALGTLADDAQDLITATADAAGEKLGEVRHRLGTALEQGKEICSRVRDQAIVGAKAADEAVHEHPYKAIAVGVGFGALVGYLLSRRCSSNGE